jgi:farnesyl-diphosphate farnesyltransferase
MNRLQLGEITVVSLKELLRSASRTFAIGIERLPGVLSEAAMVAYLLLRVSDYLEDNQEMDAEQKISLLDLWEEILTGKAGVELLTSQLAQADITNPDAVVAQHTADLLDRLTTFPPEVQSIIREHVVDSTRGMARWVARGPQVDDETDLDDYMFEVAGRVGYLVAHLYAWYSFTIRRKQAQLMPLAREFGLGLQMVNVIRGLREDYERGWMYVPTKFLAALNLSPQQFFQPEYRAEAMKVLDMLADKAERHLRHALTFVKALPPWQHGMRLACIFPLMFAMRTLTISRHNTQVLESEAKIPREEVKKIVMDATFWGWSNLWLDQYYRKLGVVSGK